MIHDKKNSIKTNLSAFMEVTCSLAVVSRLGVVLGSGQEQSTWITDSAAASGALIITEIRGRYLPQVPLVYPSGGLGVTCCT